MRFAGYAAVFDRPDRGGDVIRKGAFVRALERAGEVPLLWQHKAGTVVGRIEHLSEDARGLRVIARLIDARLMRLLESGKVDGLSFGYRVREAKGVDLVTLRALVEDASQAGAARAMGALGLDDPRARRDMDELRELLSAWRDAKRTSWRAVVTWLVRIALAALLIGIAVRLRLTDLIAS